MRKIIVFLFLISNLSCNENSIVVYEDQSIIGSNSENLIKSITPLKWFNGHKAAVTITYDIGYGLHESTYEVVKMVLDSSLCMDFEFVTAVYMDPKYKPIISSLKNSLISAGIHVFGHGHQHIKHDLLSFDDAYKSFKLCYDYMYEWGLRPISYAYPNASGRKMTTQMAVAAAGFISARGATAKSNWEQFYICPDSVISPTNWFFLPSIVVGAGSDENVNSNEEMIHYLKEDLNRSAWVTILYHSIGIEGGWAYYPMEEFKKDIKYLAGNDFWIGNMDCVSQYIYERNNLRIEYCDTENKNEICLKISDGLDNSKFYQLITIEVELNVNIDMIYVFPIINGVYEYKVKDKKVRLNLLPNESEYILHLFAKDEIPETKICAPNKYSMMLPD